MRPVKIGPFSAGVNNRLEPTQLAVARENGGGAFLYSGVNVNINARGRLKRRDGYTLRLAAHQAHSLWGDGLDGYAVVDGELTYLQSGAGGLVGLPLVADLPPLPVSFARAPDGWVYWSNGVSIGRLKGPVARSLITPRPALVPQVAAAAGGLPPGRYQVAFTADGPDGESPSTVPQVVDLPAGGGIDITGAPAGVRTYVTGPNGAVFNEVPTAAILSLTNTGAPCRTLLMGELPAGNLLAVHGGCLLSASGPHLFVSEPYYYGLHHPTRGYLSFPAPITVVQPCEDGVFLCADRTYWLADPILDTTASTVLPFGGLRGSSGFNPDTQQAFWQSPEGVVVAGPGGQVSAVQQQNLVFGAAAAGASLFRQVDGARHLIAARLGAGAASGAARAYLNQRKETP